MEKEIKFKTYIYYLDNKFYMTSDTELSVSEEYDVITTTESLSLEDFDIYSTTPYDEMVKKGIDKIRKTYKKPEEVISPELMKQQVKSNLLDLKQELKFLEDMDLTDSKEYKEFTKEYNLLKEDYLKSLKDE